MKYFNLRHLLISSLFLIPALLFMTGCRANTLYSKTGFYFDTVVEVSIYDPITQNKADELLTECMNRCQHYENLFSRTLPGSDIYNFNASSEKCTKVDHETCALVKAALEYASETRGLVDPTVGNLTPLWDISEDFTLPSDNDIQTALASVNYHNINADTENNTLNKSESSIALDLGFIAKGYIADSLKDYLAGQGIESALINLGGNILCLGCKPDGTDFKIGIKDPLNPSSTPLTSVSVNGKSVVSSGDYERSISIDGNKYHHIISTKNGYPADSDLSGVTIISDSSLEGDALSTICFILGSDDAKAFLDSNYPSVGYIFVNKEGDIVEDNLYNTQ